MTLHLLQRLSGPRAGGRRPGGTPKAGEPSRGRAARPPARESSLPAVAGQGGPSAEGSLAPEFDLSPEDRLHAFLLGQAGAVDITRLGFSSQGLAALRSAGVVLVVPLITSGELIGLIGLGPPLSERGYSREDRRLLDALAGYAAPAIRVGQLARQQQV